MHIRNQCEIDEVAALQQAIGAKELLLQEREAAFQALEQRLNSTIEQLSADLNEKQTLIGQNEAKSQQAKADVIEIVEQKTRLELLHKQTERLLSAQAEQIRAGVRAEIGYLERQLMEKESELQKCQACAVDLQHRIAEMQLLSESRAVQIEDLKAETVRLSQEISRCKAVNLGRGFSDDPERAKSQGFETMPGEISAGGDANRRASEKAETPAANEISALRQDAEEKHLLLASRNEELVRVKVEMDLLQRQNGELKASHQHIQESAETQWTKMRTELQAQVVFLQAELSQREWALEEREAAQRVLEQGLRTKIEQLEAQLEKAKTSTEGSAQEFVLGDNWESEARIDRTWMLQERLEGNGVVGAQPAADGCGKWRSSGRWKRRWRSR